MRIDKLLWYLRWCKTRSLAQKLVESGQIRLNGKRVERAHQSVKVDDILTVPLGQSVLVATLLSLPLRRGPAEEAQTCYRALDDGRSLPLADFSTTTLP